MANIFKIWLVWSLGTCVFANHFKKRVDVLKRSEESYITWQSEQRASLVSFGHRIISDLDVGATSLHLAISMWDRFIFRYGITRTEDKLYFGACLLGALRFNNYAVSRERMSSFLDGQWSAEDLRWAELMVGDILQWKLFTASPNHYIYVFYDYLSHTHVCSVLGQEFINSLSAATMQKADIGLYYAQSGVFSRDKAISYITRAVNETTLDKAMKFQIIKYMMDLMY